MQDDSIGVAVIGGGMAGRAHAAGYRSARTLFATDRPDVRLVAIANVPGSPTTPRSAMAPAVAGETHAVGAMVQEKQYLHAPLEELAILI